VNSPLTEAVRTYKALAHPVRLRVLAMLDGGELCVCQMTAVTGLAPSTVSAHLSDLKSAGLLVERKEGRWVSYAWNTEPEARRARGDVQRRLVGDPQVAVDARLLQDLRKVGVEELCRVELDLKRLGIRR
jgi:ArsR family transcriptional regulator, arsenate/arsenite/antimonite-responsive transcriptional repressor